MVLADLASHQAKHNPENVAYYFKGEAIPFKTLDDRINRCAAGLKKLGIKKGTTVGLLLRNCPEFVILTLALSRIGGVAVPINFLEKSDRIALILNDAKAVAVLTSRDLLATVQEAAKKIKSLKHIFVRDGEGGAAEPFGQFLKNKPLSPSQKAGSDESTLVLLLYTSGTTGLPKGVMLTNGNLLSNTDQCLKAIEIGPKHRFLCLLPMFHSFAFTTCVLVPLRIGAMCVINESLLPFDPVIKSIWKYKVTHFVAVPQIYSALSSRIKGAKALILRFLNPIKLCISGAAPLPAAIHKNFEKTFGIPLLEGYGLTETSPVATLNPVKKRKVGTVGLPLPGVEISIRDEDGEEVPMGAVGEIWIRGPNVMKGYYRKHKETAEVLLKNGWFKSGDMGRFDDDGYLSIVDRKKDLIIIKGLNVYPQEVENVIIKHPKVKEVAVIGKMDPKTGEEKIRAFLTIKDGEKIELSELFDLCRENLAPYKRPKDFTVLDELPKNALQKVLKKDLRKL